MGKEHDSLLIKMMLNMLNNKKGGLSVIITSAVAFIFLAIYIVVFIEVTMHLNATQNLHVIAQNNLDIISKTKVISCENYNSLKKDIKPYDNILMNYHITYTVYDIVPEIKKVLVIKDIPSKSINLDNKIVEVSIAQDRISILQKLNNLLTNKNQCSSINISEKKVIP